MLSLFSGLSYEFTVVSSAVTSVAGQGQLLLLCCALLIACAFEFVNGFHDTANAVATVIYTKSLKPVPAVIWSGFCNFAGVLFGGTAVAMGIMKLLPPDLFAASASSVALAAVFALLIGAIIWNLGTWYFGLPASSSHTLIGAIIGIGIAHAIHSGHPAASGVNWGKARDIGLALLISPLLGFSLSALLLLLMKRLSRSAALHQAPTGEQSPGWKVRSSLIATCTGVSFVHGSNDGQKGIGLMMMILMALAPTHFALKSGPATAQTLAQLASECRQTQVALRALRVPALAEAAPQKPGLFVSTANAASPVSAVAKTAAAPQAVDTAVGKLGEAEAALTVAGNFENLKPDARLDMRALLLSLDQSLSKVEAAAPSGPGATDALTRLHGVRSKIKAITEYAPSWVLILVAISIGLGTMIGWKRIVVTLGERIGRQHMTYAQGASAELVAMATIGLSAAAGLPVSTTHVLSSGIAGTMVANRSGLQNKMVRSILLAWLFTLPAAMALSASLYWLFLNVR